MELYIVCGFIVLIFSALLAMAGMGAAFIFIPIFYWLGIPLDVAIPTGLFLNAVSLTAASLRNASRKIVPYGLALPIAGISLLIAPLGAYSSRYVDRPILLALFAGFLIFSSLMILFYSPKTAARKFTKKQELASGMGIGALAGYISGLLGVGGGGLISPILIYLGHDAKKVAAVTAFVVPFSSYAGFITYLAMGHVRLPLLVITAFSAIAGGLLGTWLMNEKLRSRQVRRAIGIIILAVAMKIIIGLI